MTHIIVGRAAEDLGGHDRDATLRPASLMQTPCHEAAPDDGSQLAGSGRRLPGKPHEVRPRRRQRSRPAFLIWLPISAPSACACWVTSSPATCWCARPIRLEPDRDRRPRDLASTRRCSTALRRCWARDGTTTGGRCSRTIPDVGQARARPAGPACTATWVNGYGLPTGCATLLHARRGPLSRTRRTLRAELADITRRFDERKLVDRAKGILMRARQVSEDEAFAVLSSRLHAQQPARRPDLASR